MEEQQFESPNLWALRDLEGGVHAAEEKLPLPSPTPPLQGPAASHAHPGQAARQGAGRVPIVHSEAKIWVPSSWQRETQLAQEERSQGDDCWGRVPRRCVQDMALGCPPELSSWSWEGLPPPPALALPSKLLQLEIHL